MIAIESITRERLIINPNTRIDSNSMTPSKSTFRIYSMSEIRGHGLGMNANGEITFKTDQDREGRSFSQE